MIDKIKSEQDDIVTKAAKKAKIEPEMKDDKNTKQKEKEKQVPPFKKFRRNKSQKPPEAENMELSSLYLEPNSDGTE